MGDNKEIKKYVLGAFYKGGYRYMARHKNGDLWIYKRKPWKDDVFWRVEYCDGGLVHGNFPCFDDISWDDEEPFDIGKFLGIIDWTKVPKDTKVLVWDGEGTLKNKRYFSHYETSSTNFPFRVYCNGATSWSNTNETVGYHCCELFKDDEEGEEQDHD